MRTEDIKYVYPETLTIGTNVTLTINPMPGQLGIILKYGAGGTLFIFGQSTGLGCTFATAQEYKLGATEVYSMNLTGHLSLYAAGTTTTCFLSRTFGAGSSLQQGA